MDRQTKILASAFGTLIVFAIFYYVFYPVWIAPMLRIDEEIEGRLVELKELEELEREALDARDTFRSFANRNGSFDWTKVEMNVRQHLSDLAAKHGMLDPNVQQGRRRSVNKTDLDEVTISFRAEGTLEAVVLFLKDVAEMPYVSLVENPSIRPGRREWEVPSGYTLSLQVRTLVLPQHRLVGKIDEASLTQPEKCIRHEDNDYATIWEHKPFYEDVIIPPLEVRPKDANVRVQEGRAEVLEVVVRGGDKNYTFDWSPSTGIEASNNNKVRLITDGTGTRSYTCTVTDGHGHSNAAQFSVEVTPKPEPPKPVVQRDKKPEPPVDTGPKRWADNKYRALRMALIHSGGGERVAELMVENSKSRETEYYRSGDEFDGGTLLYVHQTGGLVQRADDLYVYPMGVDCAQDIPVDAAAEFPRLQLAADYVRQTIAHADEAAKAVETSNEPAEHGTDGHDQVPLDNVPGASTDDAADDTVKGTPADAVPKRGALDAIPGTRRFPAKEKSPVQRSQGARPKRAPAVPRGDRPGRSRPDKSTAGEKQPDTSEKQPGAGESDSAQDKRNKDGEKGRDKGTRRSARKPVSRDGRKSSGVGGRK